MLDQVARLAAELEDRDLAARSPKRNGTRAAPMSAPT
jgi:hypothetical protein